MKATPYFYYLDSFLLHKTLTKYFILNVWPQNQADQNLILIRLKEGKIPTFYSPDRINNFNFYLWQI